MPKKTNRKKEKKRCQSKRKYDGEHEAQKACNSYWLSYKEAMMPYKCRICGAWHIGHKNKKYRIARMWNNV